MKTLRTAVLLGLGAAIAAAAWFAWRGDGEPMRESPPTATKSVAPPPESAAPERSEGGATVAAERTAADAVVKDPRADTGRHVRGTIVVVDGHGIEHAQTDGSMNVDAIVAAGGGKPQRIETVATKVTAGRWEAVVPSATFALHADEIVLDGLPATGDEPSALPPGDAPIALRARRSEPMNLRVLGGDTGADLTDVRIVSTIHWHLDECTHPGNDGVTNLHEHAVSPIVLPHSGRAEKLVVWAHSPGYAWNRIELATAEPGERVLRLAPGGDVDLTVVGKPPEGAVLRVRSEARSGSPFAEFHLTGDTTRIDGLPVGRWSLALEKGLWFQSPVGLGTTTVDVTRGALATASITMQAAARPPLVQVQGTLQLDPSWGIEPGFVLEPLSALSAWSETDVTFDAQQLTNVGTGRYRWGPRNVLAGRYGVVLRATGYRAVVDVGPQATTDLAIVVPPPNEVRLRLLDAVNGAPITGASPSWYTTPPEGWDKGWGHVETEEVGNGWYRFRAPTGAISIHALPEGYAFTLEARDVLPGPNEIVVRVKRVCGIDILLKDGDVVVPWPSGAIANIENVVTKAGVAYWSGSKVAAKEPGEHTLTITPIEGFEPIPARKVTVTEGEWTKVEIVLRRKQ